MKKPWLDGGGQPGPLAVAYGGPMMVDSIATYE
jgi:hypothetical protein